VPTLRGAWTDSRPLRSRLRRGARRPLPPPVPVWAQWVEHCASEAARPGVLRLRHPWRVWGPRPPDPPRSKDQMTRITK
jgi:hypothetical protein